MEPGVFAYVCAGCNHLASIHGKVDGAPIAGPYVCQDCDCQIPQDAPMYALDRQQWERRYGLTGV